MTLTRSAPSLLKPALASRFYGPPRLNAPSVNNSTTFFYQAPQRDSLLWDRSLIVVVIIGSLFLSITLAITLAAVVFCKKKNTVFVLQKSEQVDDDVDAMLDDALSFASTITGEIFTRQSVSSLSRKSCRSDRLRDGMENSVKWHRASKDTNFLHPALLRGSSWRSQNTKRASLTSSLKYEIEHCSNKLFHALHYAECGEKVEANRLPGFTLWQDGKCIQKSPSRNRENSHSAWKDRPWLKATPSGTPVESKPSIRMPSSPEKFKISLKASSNIVGEDVRRVYRSDSHTIPVPQRSFNLSKSPQNPTYAPQSPSVSSSSSNKSHLNPEDPPAGVPLSETCLTSLTTSMIHPSIRSSIQSTHPISGLLNNLQHFTSMQTDNGDEHEATALNTIPGPSSGYILSNFGNTRTHRDNSGEMENDASEELLGELKTTGRSSKQEDFFMESVDMV